MNVLYLLNHAGKAGTERYVQTLIEKLHPIKSRPFLCIMRMGFFGSAWSKAAYRLQSYP
jgi:hypothetical protein